MKLQILKVLVDLKERLALGKFLPSVGICGYVYRNVDTDDDNQFSVSNVQDYMEGLFVHWPEFSGEVEYPVPSDTPDMTARNRYWSADKWPTTRWEGEYGESRKRLLDFMITTIKAELGTEYIYPSV